MDFNAPSISGNYATGYTDVIVAHQKELAKFLASDTVSISNPVTGIKRYNAANLLFEQYNGGWAEMPLAYAKTTGAAFTGTVGISPSNSSALPLVLYANNSAGAIDIIGRASTNYSAIRFINNAYNSELARLEEDGSNFRIATYTGQLIFAAGGGDRLWINAGTGVFTLGAPSSGYHSIYGALHLLGAGGTGHVATLGNDMRIHDIDIADTINFQGNSDNTSAALKLGVSGPTVRGNNSGLWVDRKLEVSAAASEHGLVAIGPPSGSASGYYAGYFSQSNNRNYGKVLFLGTTDVGGGDGPMIHFLHAGISQWGFGIEHSDGTGLAMYHDANATSTHGSKRFTFEAGGNFSANGSITAGANIQSGGNVHTGASGSYYVYSYGSIYAEGNITAYYVSDERLKEDITPLTDAMAAVRSLSGFRYRFNELGKKVMKGNYTDKWQVGVSAQQVQRVLPEVTPLAPVDMDQQTGESISGENYLTVQYEKITPLLIEALKEVDRRLQRVEGVVA